jgi:CRISPR-associated protein Csb3
MNGIVLRGCVPHVLLSHMALYGLAAILERVAAERDGPSPTLWWTSDATPRPAVEAPGLDGEGLAEAVLAHATPATVESSWVQADVELKGSSRGLMSPRLTGFGDRALWEEVQRRRHGVIDDLTGHRRWLDLRLVGALGEPSYWSRNLKGETQQDDGASRLEMQPRNQGSEFVGSRLRKVAAAVTARSAEAVLSGLAGDTVTDVTGAGKADSRTATGFANPGPTDDVVAWCALWGISQFPIAPRVDRPAATSGHVGRSRREWFHVPMWHVPLRPARVRSVLASEALRVVAAAAAEERSTEGPARGRRDPSPPTRGEVTAAGAWLSARGVAGVMLFPIARFGSDSAPERRAMRGEPVAIAGRA